MFGFKASLLKTGETQMMDTLWIEPKAFRMRSACIPLHHVPLRRLNLHTFFVVIFAKRHSGPATCGR